MVDDDGEMSLADSGYGSLSPAWEQVIEQRSREVDEGVSESLPGDQAFAEVEAELRVRRGSR